MLIRLHENEDGPSIETSPLVYPQSLAVQCSSVTRDGKPLRPDQTGAGMNTFFITPPRFPGVFTESFKPSGDLPGARARKWEFRLTSEHIDTPVDIRVFLEEFQMAPGEEGAVYFQAWLVVNGVTINREMKWLVPKEYSPSPPTGDFGMG